jgi:DNA-binding transcriptional LysR family regulator
MFVNVRSIDLRLLIVFDAIMAERSVSRAARRIGMSQPAMSNALNRLRSTVNDQLFTRTAEGVRPTPRAIELSIPVGEALKQIQEALEPREFDPATVDWTFNLALSDQATIVVLHRLYRLLESTAPKVRLCIQPKSNATIQSRLDAADVELAVGVIPNLPRRFKSIVLFEDRYVCMMHRRHVLARQKIGADDFARSHHLAVRPALDLASQIDKQLRRYSVKRNVVLNVSQFQAVPEVLRSSNLIACLLKSVTEQFDHDEFVFHPIPFAIHPVNIVVAWSRSRTRHAANAWMRQKLVEACQDLRI